MHKPSKLSLDFILKVITILSSFQAASPSCTELEQIVLDWFAKAMDLPERFLSNNTGGGAFQTSASDAIFIAMLAARNQAIKYLKDDDEDREDSEFLPRLVAYCSSECHSCVEKAAKISLIKLRIIEADEDGALRPDCLKSAMEKDEENGLFPFFVCAILGSTACTSFDNLEEIGPICRERPHVWLHVDAAYAGNSFICPELRYLMKGIHYADSFNTNPNKWLLTNFDCSCLWVASKDLLTSAMVVDPLYLQHKNSDEAIDYRHWGIPLSRRFRALKLWFVFRKYGISGLQCYIRNHIRLAKYFRSLLEKDHRFELANDVRLGLVCFRLAGSDKENQDLLARINESGKLHMIPATVRGKYTIRFCVTAENATADDMDRAFEIIQIYTSELLSPIRPKLTRSKSRRFSFTRSVSQEVYRRSISRTNLYDGATPIVIPENETPFVLNEFAIDEEVFENNNIDNNTIPYSS